MRAMQQWLDRFCYKHPRLSIPGLMRYIVIGNVLVFLLDLFSTGGYPIATSLLSFSSDAILQGQIWRIITFVFVPATSRNIFLFAITLYFYYFIGNALEREWGSNKFTIFYFFGILLNILVGFLVGTASMYYVLNYLLFFAADIGSQFSYWKGRAKNRARQNQYRQAYNHPGSGPKVVNFHDAKTKTKTQYLHKCAVCGKTDLTDPQMEFRYCSRCNGYYCYCADHINNHIHIQ